MPPCGFEAAFPATERSQAHALDPAATGMGEQLKYRMKIIYKHITK